jgi:hypothetical protein
MRRPKAPSQGKNAGYGAQIRLILCVPGFRCVLRVLCGSQRSVPGEGSMIPQDCSCVSLVPFVSFASFVVSQRSGTAT